MGKRDKLREFIHLAIECYNTAADPPCIDYAKQTEPYDKINHIPSSRTTLLRIGIDVKYILSNYLARIPRARAVNMLQWIEDGSQYAEYQLTDYHRQWLIADRRRLKLILKDNKYQ